MGAPNRSSRNAPRVVVREEGLAARAITVK